MCVYIYIYIYYIYIYVKDLIRCLSFGDDEQLEDHRSTSHWKARTGVRERAGECRGSRTVTLIATSRLIF